MLLSIIFFIISLFLSGLIYFYTNIYDKWYYYFILLVLLPVLFIAVFAIYVIILFVISLFMNKKKEINKPNKFYYFIVSETIKLLLILSRTKIKVEGKELIDPNKRYLVVSNHISNFDPFLAIVSLKLKPLIGVTKKENLNIPIAGAFIHYAGFISLDRSSARSGVVMVKKAVSYIDNNQASIYICPEGTRSKTNELLPFHAGSFKIATKSMVDIIVCYIENTDKIAKNFPFRKTNTRIKVLKVIPKEEVISKNTNELSLEAYELIKNEKES